MQYANKMLRLNSQDFSMIIEKIKSSNNELAGGTLYGYDDGQFVTVNQISINENHADYADSEQINSLQTKDPYKQYIGEWFYHPGFGGWIDSYYDDIMQKKSESAARVQEHKSPVVIVLDIVDDEIMAVATQLSAWRGFDIMVKSAEGIDYFNHGLKLEKVDI